ncbi:hypothetical protein, partial [Micromonospora sp. Rc5]|uniref:hypothetical protein n=2 Tax=unclassified Micromonospora TaxID=2617518 RepID=UPI001E2F92B8
SPTPPPMGPDPTGPDPTATAPGPSRVARNVVLRQTYTLDLDSSAPNWDVENASIYESGDIYFGTTSATLQTTGDVVLLKGEPNWTTCEESTDRQDKVVRRDQVKIGLSICVRTTEDKWAWLTVKSYEPSTKVTFDITVW